MTFIESVYQRFTPETSRRFVRAPLSCGEVLLPLIVEPAGVKHFIQTQERLVQDAIDGLIASSGGALNRLNGFPEIKVVVRADWKKDRVAVISGGGSGHEPAHAGFVGKGMLTAAVCGEVFASPSVGAVLAAIRAVTGPPGCLLVVKNYTGDRLNFGLAAERAKEEGLNVSMVVVSDDVSIAESAQPRGIAGTLFVHKVAGYLAEAGEDLERVTKGAQDVADGTKSLGLALTTCHPPGSSDKETLSAEEAELGLGIHGEPGVAKIPMASADELMSRVCQELTKSLAEGDLVVLLNNLGTVTPLEMSVLTGALLKTELGKRAELLLGPSPLMTSYDMKGFSISALVLDDALRKALTARVEPVHWPAPRKPVQPEPLPLPPTEATNFQVSENSRTKSALQALCKVLKEARERLNSLDAKIGDGDAGDTFYTAASSIEKKLDQMPLDDPKQLLKAISQTLSHGMGGSSGALLSLFTQAASTQFQGNWSEALLAGTDKMMEYGGAKIGDRTMLDALVPALEALNNGQSLAEAAQIADQKAQATAQLEQAGAGRSSYLKEESLKGVEDPGARAVALAFQALGE